MAVVGALLLALECGGKVWGQMPRQEPPRLPFALDGVARTVRAEGCYPVFEHELINPLNQRYNALGWVLNPGDPPAQIDYSCEVSSAGAGPDLQLGEGRDRRRYQALLHFKCVAYSGEEAPRLGVRIVGPDEKVVARQVVSADGEFEWASLQVPSVEPGEYRIEVRTLGSSFFVGWIANCAYFLPFPWTAHMATQWAACYGLAQESGRVPVAEMSRNACLASVSAFMPAGSGQNVVGWQVSGPEVHSFQVRWDLPHSGAPQTVRLGLLAWWPHGHGELRVASPGAKSVLAAPIFPSPEVRCLWWELPLAEEGSYTVTVADEGVGTAQALVLRDLFVAPTDDQQ